MIDSRRLCLDLHINSRPVRKFDGKKTYISTGDSDDMENADTVTFHNRPSRANVAPIKNDVIFAKMANTDKTFLIDEDLATNIYSTGFFDVSSTRILPKFLYYLIQSDEFDSYKNAYSEGTTQISISDKRLKKIKITYETDKAKQQQIVNYLDKKVGIIDKLIANINQQIEDLRLFKFSMISEYTSSQTLNKYKIKYKNTIVDKKSEFDGQPYFALENIVSGSGEYIDTDAEYSTKGATVCKENDICFGKLRPYLRKYFFVTKKTTCSTEFAVFREKIPTKYMYYLIQSEEFLQLCNAFSEGTKMPRINIEKLKNWKFGFPSVEEQKIFVKNMDAVSTKIEQLIQIKRQKIMELKEYKKSLIYECVTGQKEVL